MIILLSGSKGAGKSTAANILLPKISNAVYLSIDEVRRSLPADSNKDILEKNKEAFEIMIAKTKLALHEQMNVVVDCGVSEERAARFEAIAKETETPLHKFFLRASYETQLERVRDRDKAKGRESTDVVRFDEIYHYFSKNSLDGYVVLETDKLDEQQVVETILATIS